MHIPVYIYIYINQIFNYPTYPTFLVEGVVSQRGRPAWCGGMAQAERMKHKGRLAPELCETEISTRLMMAAGERPKRVARPDEITR